MKMTEAATIRDDLVSSIEETLAHTDQWLDEVLNRFHWTKEGVTQQNEVKVQCLRDMNHHIPETAAEKHDKFCMLSKLGYSKSELEDEEKKSSKFFYENSDTVISVDLEEGTIRNILSRAGGRSNQNDNGVLPLTMSHGCDLSREQRLLIYQYCVDTAVAAKKPTTVPIEDLRFPTDEERAKDNVAGQSKSVMELKAEERDLKRRRQSYRSKNVHTANKSYKEVIRDVIEAQTGFLRERLEVQQRAKSSRDRRRSPSSAGDRRRSPSLTGDRRRSPSSAGDRRRSPSLTGDRRRSPSSAGDRRRSPPSAGDRRRSPSSAGDRCRSPPSAGDRRRSPPSAGDRRRSPSSDSSRQHNDDEGPSKKRSRRKSSNKRSRSVSSDELGKRTDEDVGQNQAHKDSENLSSSQEDATGQTSKQKTRKKSKKKHKRHKKHKQQKTKDS